jgi:hypothetical protein
MGNGRHAKKSKDTKPPAVSFSKPSNNNPEIKYSNNGGITDEAQDSSGSLCMVRGYNGPFVMIFSATAIYRVESGESPGVICNPIMNIIKDIIKIMRESFSTAI